MCGDDREIALCCIGRRKSMSVVTTVQGAPMVVGTASTQNARYPKAHANLGWMLRIGGVLQVINSVYGKRMQSLSECRCCIKIKRDCAARTVNSACQSYIYMHIHIHSRYF